ncbi:allergen [Metarhizium album ARSEF 1941]|uniref:Allergen n=1 Tax=Metarhizium album (strain ARSEF 1941) TaxID=1081103 RepID=A0A0B2WSS9_METAS|nr:allergen [Metarhizium album ARSEF 1941]KHN96010.1 allergen [Metarhizium album ARSEF 1941]
MSHLGVSVNVGQHHKPDVVKSCRLQPSAVDPQGHGPSRPARRRLWSQLRGAAIDDAQRQMGDFYVPPTFHLHSTGPVPQRRPEASLDIGWALVKICNGHKTMEKAKKAVSNFLSQDGKHKTTVDEDVREAVTEEHVYPEQHEQIVTAVNREVHQDHHQTVIQPIKAKETVPEKHTYNAVPVEHKTVEHGNKEDVQAALQKDAANYVNSSTTHDTKRTATAAPAVQGEHTQHHVHHHIQHVIEKETIQPEYIHTTVPVHETHHAKPIHHEATVLPAKSLEEYTASRGDLQAHPTNKVKEFPGCPTLKDKSLESKSQGQQAIHGH